VTPPITTPASPSVWRLPISHVAGDQKKTRSSLVGREAVDLYSGVCETTIASATYGHAFGGRTAKRAP